MYPGAIVVEIAHALLACVLLALLAGSLRRRRHP